MKTTQPLQFDRFESRVLPAVMVSNFGDDLLIVGTPGNDDITVQANPGYVKVTGSHVSFSPDFDPNQFKRDLVISTGSGSDHITVKHSFVPGNTRVNAGPDHDKIILKNYNNGAGVLVHAGEGNDTVAVKHISGGTDDMNVNLEAGDDKAFLTHFSIQQDININDGEGNDFVKVKHVYSGHELEINNPIEPLARDTSGLGDDTFKISHASFGDDFDDTKWYFNQGHDKLFLKHVHVGERSGVDVRTEGESSLLTADIRYVNFSSSVVMNLLPGLGDVVSMTNFHINGDLVIDGTNQLNLHGFSLTGAMKLNTAGAQDVVEISRGYVPTLEVKLGGGDDHLTITDVSAQQAHLDGGTGNNSLCLVHFWFGNGLTGIKHFASEKIIN